MDQAPKETSATPSSHRGTRANTQTDCKLPATPLVVSLSCGTRDLPLPKTPVGAILVSGSSGIRGKSVKFVVIESQEIEKQ